ncbi:hypothetical protein [Isoptericola aurantiacus]|uniref:hypothetical protein n=1 Tax=Isoptericola aurantiacus TaxID=3377839 RepID=UPI00383B1B5F
MVSLPAVALLAAVDPSPSPTARVLDDWEVTPGLAGFLATFGVAVCAVLLFLSLSRHMRKADAYARAHGIEVPQRRRLGVRRDATGTTPPVDDVPTSPSDGLGSPASPDDVGSPDVDGEHHRGGPA